MKLNELFEADVSSENPEITGITADSRAVKPGFLFAALKGTAADGARFIPQAEEAGAVAVLALPGTTASVPVVESSEPRLKLAQLAAMFHAGQPATIAGITGTNGKTSIARFCQQIWTLLGLRAGSLGTLGAFSDSYEYTLRHTTPDPVETHQILSTMAKLGNTHLAMEVSSHGLEQFRADGIRFSLAAFTNITRDHLDYHPTFEDYFKAKMRLFTELLPQDGKVVVNIDGAESSRVVDLVRQSGKVVLTVGRAGDDLKLIETSPLPDGQKITVEAGDGRYDLTLPLIGYFQAENALVAAALVMASGYAAGEVLPLLEHLKGAPGRMEHVVDREVGNGKAGIYVDYAHTPDAITTALKAIRPHALGKIIIIIGAGGDRDKVKRPQMGEAAMVADEVIVTDDNPRSEDPAQIRREVLAGCPGAAEIADRQEAIRAGVDMLAAGDVLLIAGKGHESGQTVGKITTPFNDAEVARSVVGQS